MATVSWDAQSVVYMDSLEKGKMDTELSNADLLGWFDANLQDTVQFREKVLFHYKNKCRPPEN